MGLYSQSALELPIASLLLKLPETPRLISVQDISNLIKRLE